MAATIVSNVNVEYEPIVVDEVTLSLLTADLLESVTPASAAVTSTAGHTLVVPVQDVTATVLTPPTARGAVTMSYEGQSSTTGALSVRFFGSDLTGAVVKVRVSYYGVKAGSISSATE